MGVIIWWSYSFLAHVVLTVAITLKPLYHPWSEINIHDLVPSSASFVAQLVKNLPTVQETWVQSLGWEDPWSRERLPTPVFWPGEFHGLYSPRGRKESDTTEPLWLSLSTDSERLQNSPLSALPCLFLSTDEVDGIHTHTHTHTHTHKTESM